MATCKEINSGSDQITQLCNLCESNVSDGYCDECEDFMCQSCFDIHSKVKACKHHVLLDDVCEKDKKKAYSEPCKHHPNQRIEYYCIGHEIVGCVKCFFTDHRTCQHQNIEDAVKTFKDSGEDTRLKREIQRLENMHSEYTDQCEHDQETAAGINNAVVNGVKSFKDKVTSYVANMEERVLEKAEGLRLENETRLQKRVTELDSVGEELELCMVKLENQDSADKLFIEALKIKPKVEKLGRKMSSLRCQNVVTKYEFQPNKLLLEMIQESRSCGEIAVPAEEPQSRQTDVSHKYVDVSAVYGVLNDLPSSSVDPHPAQSIATKRKTKGETKNNRSEIKTGNALCPPASKAILQHKLLSNAVMQEDYDLDPCLICMDTVTDPKTIQCGHTFCTECIDLKFQYQKICPKCGKLCGVITGDQPDGTMSDGVNIYKHLPGYEDYGTIYITYNFNSGRQQDHHPSPGTWYKAIQCTAYLPNNEEGKRILNMLKVAFERKLIFTIGNSRKTGQEGVIIWNGIHHKTDPRPNTQFGYPDPTYLARVKDELAAKGVTEDDI